MSKRKTGTKEWSTHSVNIQKGCENNCRYGYCRDLALRFPKLMPKNGWENPELKPLPDKYPKYNGVVMFPTQHDITPQNVDKCFYALSRLLEAGNQVLIVTKPTLACVTHLCHMLRIWKPQIMWRFTIGNIYDEVLKYWEPNAPGFQERLDSLTVAHSHGYRTSVSIEPMLGSTGETCVLVDKIAPFVSDSIWIGRMNKPAQRVKCETDFDRHMLDELLAAQTDYKLRELYETLQHNPKVRWKESIASALGLPPSEDTWSTQ